jgi:enoyl-CoA hydratase
MHDSLHYLKLTSDAGVAEIEFDRPKALNALNGKLLDELQGVLDQLTQDQTLRCLILTGAGQRAFVAGADIAEMQDFSPSQAEAFSKRGHTVFDTLASLPVPVLAAVNGYALGGGCELALATDIIYASEKARFGQPEVKLGLLPGFGGCVRLVERIGQAAASEWIFTGDLYTANQAKEVGLVHNVFVHDELLSKVRQVAQTIASRAPLAVRAAKKVLRARLLQGHAASAKVEQGAFGEIFQSQDMRDGMAAFLDKTQVQFKGC